MNIAIRVDASFQRGTGHIIRCMALARYLVKQGAQVTFFCREIPESMVSSLIAQPGLHLKRIPPEGEDSDQTIRLLTLETAQWEWLVVDHYELDTQWEKKLKPHVKAILVIDDLANRSHDCDLLLDQNYFPSPETRYQNLITAGCELLLGPRYALLREEFTETALKQVVRQGSVHRILVSFGGSDPTGEALKLLRAILAPQFQDQLQTLQVMIIGGAANPALPEIERLAASYPQIRCYGHTDNMAMHMSQADLFIGAGGTSSWERLALGLPAIIIAIAPNQAAISLALAEAGCQWYLGENVSEEQLRSALIGLLSQPGLLHLMGEQGPKIVDAKGCSRVVAQMLAPLITLRQAIAEDCPLLYEWRNHPEVREQSHQPSPIHWEAHQSWFKSALCNPAQILLVGENAGLPVGVLRYDLFDDGKACRISIYRVPGSAGQGLGSHLLKAGSQWLRDNLPEVQRVEAEIRSGNIASIRAFEKAGFIQRYQVYELLL